MISMENLNWFILYEKQNSYEIDFSINDFEIKDNVINSTFKKLLSARKNVELNEEKKYYEDFNIACEITLLLFN